jgi:hypothetical protein
MKLPQFNAEASLREAAGVYRTTSYERSGATEVVATLKPRPTFDNPSICFKGAGESACEGLLCWCCYSDGCWICDNWFDVPANCVWDDSYRVHPGWRWKGAINNRVFANW